MTRSNLIQSAVLAWIVAILLSERIFSIASGPMMKIVLSMEDDPSGLRVHKKLQNLNITTSTDFDGIKNTTYLFSICLISFLACVICLIITLTILMICPEGLCRKILYAVFLFLFTAVFIGLTIWSRSLYVNLYDGKIDPYNTNDLHGQMTSSLKYYFWSDNFTTGTKMSNEWNQLFIDFECCGVNKVIGTTNDFDHTSWCTTNGSCQATASQIPKTCCKGFTKYDYQNAPPACHSSVNPGQYYDKGCFSVIRKEVIKERSRFNSVTDDILTEELRLILVMGSCSFLSLIGMCVFIGICLMKKDKAENRATSQTYDASTMSEHAHNMYPSFPRNIITDSTMTEHAHERIRHNTSL